LSKKIAYNSITRPTGYILPGDASTLVPRVPGRVHIFRTGGGRERQPAGFWSRMEQCNCNLHCKHVQTAKLGRQCHSISASDNGRTLAGVIANQFVEEK